MMTRIITVLTCTCLLVFSSELIAQSQTQSNSSSNGDKKQQTKNQTNKSQNKPLTPQQKDALGQEALDGELARKQQEQQEELRIEAAKAGVDRGVPDRMNADSGQIMEEDRDSQRRHQNPQVEAEQQMSDEMPDASFLNRESDQDEGENKAQEQVNESFYDSYENQ